MPRIAVIGLGRFGYTLAKELSARKAEVIALDHSPTPVEQIKDEVDLAIRLDATDELALCAVRKSMKSISPLQLRSAEILSRHCWPPRF
ncbi:MAG: NAD-binding protein [Planctomycetaceae bacterium]